MKTVLLLLVVAVLVITARFWIKRGASPAATESPAKGSQERVDLSAVQPENQRRDLEKLLGAVVPFAELMLRKEGEFYPHGATMNGEGKISHEGGYTGSEHPRPTEVIDLLKGAFRAQAKAGEIKACALVYDVRTVPPGRTEKTDAVEVDLDHRGGMSISVIYPYLIAPDKTVTFSQSFAIRGKSEVFQSRPGDVGGLPKNAPAQP